MAKKSLEERIQNIEDYIEIMQLVCSYGPAADATHWDLIKEIWSDDCVYEIGGLGSFAGHEGLKQAFYGEFHQGLMESGSGHVSSMPHLVIRGRTCDWDAPRNTLQADRRSLSSDPTDREPVGI